MFKRIKKAFLALMCAGAMAFTLIVPINTTSVYAETQNSDIEAFVERMYTVALNRPSDAAGKANWVHVLRANTHDGAGIAKEFIFGEEFKLRNLTDEQYVDVLYHTFFNRDADEGGKELWLAVLASGQTREYVLSNFVNLPEFTMLCASYGIERGVILENGDAVNPGIPQFVKRLYTIVLERDAENEGLYNNVLALVTKVETAESIATNFFTSEEYMLKAKDNTAFIKDLYLTFMNREADTDGLYFWNSCLATGMTREEVINEFIKSDEFTHILCTYGLIEEIPVKDTPSINEIRYLCEKIYDKKPEYLGIEGLTAEIMVNTIKEQGYDSLIAYAIVTRMLNNSRGNMYNLEINDNGVFIGLFQWNEENFEKMLDWSYENNFNLFSSDLDEVIECQTLFLLHELETNPEYKMRSSIK